VTLSPALCRVGRRGANMELTVKELGERIRAELFVPSGLKGDEVSQIIRAVGPVSSAGKTTVTFLAEERHLAGLKNARAGACIVGRPIEGLPMPQLVVKNVNAGLIESLKIFAPRLEPPVTGVHPTAQVGRKVKMGRDVSIGPFVFIGDDAEIGDNTVVAAGCRIGQNTKVGTNCRLDCNVVIYHNCIIGSSVIIQANSTIGSVGFGYALIDGAHRLIPHNGIVVIEDFVEIGANCCVDRAKFGETRIGTGTKIDNLVQIAHNVTIGKCCLIVAQVGIAGSSKIGNGVVLAGQAGVGDNIEIGDGAVIGAQAGVIGNVPPGKQVLLMPAVDRQEALRAIAAMLRLPKLMEQFKKLSARVDKLEAAKDNSRPDRT
jgi:UDP-3-O-[3-hydroxymyristoyl] glucosamine N-acyltransferase